MPKADIHVLRRAQSEARAAGLVSSDALVPSLAILIELGSEYVDLLAQIQHPPMAAQIREAVRAFLTQGHLDGCADADPVWGLIVEALVLNMASAHPSAALVQKAEEKLRAAPYWVHDAWRDRCAECIRSMAAQQRTAWVTALGVEPTVTVEGKSKAAVAIRRSAAPWTVESPFDLWDQSPARLDGNWYAPLQLVERVDPSAWFVALDSWQDARLVHAALFFGALRNSPDRILASMQAARIRPEGELSVSTTLLCEDAVEAAEELIKSGEESDVEAA